MWSTMGSALFFSVCVFSSLECVFSTVYSPTSTCPHHSTPFFNNLQSQCPVSYFTNSPLEVDDDFLDKKFNSKWGEGYTSILFYGSSCLFSHNVYLTFKVLGSMFPQIEHLSIEQSSAMPSTFSRHGIHSLPAIIMVNESSSMRFQGAKDLHSLIKFYKKATGFEPVHCVGIEQPVSSESSRTFVMQSWIGSSIKEILNREPYLVISLLFLCTRAFVFLFPKILSYFNALWILYRPHLKLEIFGETSHMFGRALLMINLKTVWTNLKLYKTRNFHQGAKNARVWASLSLSRS